VGKGQLLNIQNRFLDEVVGGWQVGSLLTLQSGQPGNVTIGGVDNASTTGNADRPNATGSPYLSNPTPSRYYSLAAFSEAPARQFGNAGRNAVIGPGIFNIDFEAAVNTGAWKSATSDIPHADRPLTE
jgi:hypothetical protein